MTHVLHGSRGGRRRPVRSTSGGKRAAARVPGSPRASRRQPVPLDGFGYEAGDLAGGAELDDLQHGGRHC